MRGREIVVAAVVASAVSGCLGLGDGRDDAAVGTVGTVATAPEAPPVVTTPPGDRRTPDQGSALVVRSGSFAQRCETEGPLVVVYDPDTGVRVSSGRTLVSASADATVINRRRCADAGDPPGPDEGSTLEARVDAGRVQCPVASGEVRVDVTELAGPPGTTLGRALTIREGVRTILTATLEPGRARLAVGC